MSFDLVAKTLYGLEEILASELQELGAENINSLNRAVAFRGDKELVYKSNYLLRTALRILRPLIQFKARDPESLYRHIYEFTWENWFTPAQTIAVESVVFSDYFNHSLYISQKVKDAIADRFRKLKGKRPSVDLDEPDIRISVHVSQDNFTISLDSSGEALNKRGYRTDAFMAPLNEVLAAGMIRISEWDPVKPFIDPMCGSATLPIEAGMIAGNYPSGFFRKKFGFQQWLDYDSSLFARITGENMPDEAREFMIMGSDISGKAVNAAIRNLRNTGMDKKIKISPVSFMELQTDWEKGWILINPPYGERVKSSHLDELYRSIGSKLKKDFAGFEAWILSGNPQFMKNVGLKTSRKKILYNGPILCNFNKFELYQGSRKPSRL